MQKSMLLSVGLFMVLGQAYAADNPAPPSAMPSTAPAPASTPIEAPSPQAAMPSLSGAWSSNLVDETILEQSGNRITGSYSYMDEDDITQAGRIEATIENQTIRGKWWERPKVGSGDESRGDLEWKILDNGKALMGWYRDEGDEEKQDWNLTR